MKFTKETEFINSPLLLDVLVSRLPNVRLAVSVHNKSTHKETSEANSLNRTVFISQSLN